MSRLGTDQPGRDATLDAAALHGLAVFCRLTRFAVVNNVPLVMDF
jgi:hypothetical protein